MAILSRAPFSEIRIGLPATEFETHGRYLEVDLPGGATVASLYIHTGEAGTARQLEKERFMAELAKRMAELSADGRHAVLRGLERRTHRARHQGLEGQRQEVGIPAQ